ncbi:S-layer homology domain-containing protein [Natronincola ferrireducens]|uniref:S-layer homology domain-containing protein n=1 Tax=Natronincola ferrireducens TaxID=393762 RepID=A0A1G8WUT2_9FIRM|nr:S-layer homology domain-containing protein [Natronincola ferrireducens]SDJ82149.1 S-layer homology domain-containing protein [Natronincola ferrireducens]
MKKSQIAIVLSIILIFSMTMTAMADISATDVTRVEFVKVLLELGNIDVNKASTSSFTDVTNPQDIPYVETAVQRGIASGYRDHFYPNDIVTKEQAIAMVIKSFGELDVAEKVTPEMMKKHLAFKDGEFISSWAKPYVTYGVMKGIIDGDKEVYSPKSSLNLEELKELMRKAKPVFTREGMTASEMLEKVTEKIEKFDTMKYTLNMDMKSHVIDRVEGQEVFMTMDIILEGAIDQKNDQIHLVTTTTTKAGEEVVEAVVEMIMTEDMMYMKFPETEQWMAINIDPLMKELEAMLGTSMDKNTGISQQQMELFGMRASYLPEEKIDGEDYYVVAITVDQKAYRAAMDEILKNTMDLMVEMMGVGEVALEEKAEMEEAIKLMLHEMLTAMEMEVEYKYYIHQETKLMDKMEVDQAIHMKAGTVENHSVSKGVFRYYDFNEPVNIPTINPEDLMADQIL